MKNSASARTSLMVSVGVWLCALLLQFFPLLFQGKVLFFGDNYSLQVPTKVYAAEWLRKGVLALWNPTILGGISIVGDTAQTPLYPSLLLYVFANAGTATTLNVLLHLSLAYWGMYVFARTFVRTPALCSAAGVAWMCSTQVTGSINNLATLQAIVWAPWVLWCCLHITATASRKWIAVAAFVIAGLVYAGYPQHILVCVGVGGVLNVWQQFFLFKKPQWRQWVKQWLLVAVWSFCLSAPALLPFFETFLASTRMTQSATQAQVGSIHPLYFVKMIVPYFFDKPAFGVKWGPGWNGMPQAVLYVGWLLLLCAGACIVSTVQAAKQLSWPRILKHPQHSWSTFFVMSCAVITLLSLGKFLPGYTELQALIPLLRIGRYPSIAFFIVNLFVIILACVQLERWRPTRQVMVASMCIAGGVCLASALLLTINTFTPEALWQDLNTLTMQRLAHSAFHTLERDQKIITMISESIVVSSLLFVCGVLAWSRKRFGVLSLLVALDVVYATHSILYFGPASLYGESPEQTKLAQAIDSKHYRSLTRNFNTPYTDYGSYWEAMMVRAPFSDSFVDAQEGSTYHQLHRLRDGATPNWNLLHGISTINGYTTLLNQTYADTWSTQPDTPINYVDHISPIDPKLAAWSVKYYIVDSWYNIAESLPGKKIYDAGGHQVYELPALPKIRHPDQQLGEKERIPIEFLFEGPNQLAFIANISEKSDLLIANTYDPNWKYQLNELGAFLPVQNLNGMILIPNLETHPHFRVVLTYVPTLFYIGLCLAALGVLTIGIYNRDELLLLIVPPKWRNW